MPDIPKVPQAEVIMSARKGIAACYSFSQQVASFRGAIQISDLANSTCAKLFQEGKPQGAAWLVESYCKKGAVRFETLYNLESYDTTRTEAYGDTVSYKKESPYKYCKNSCTGCGGRIWTYDLRVMSLFFGILQHVPPAFVIPFNPCHFNGFLHFESLIYIFVQKGHFSVSRRKR